MTTRGIEPFGQMVDVGGYRLHAHVVGSGQPAVIMDSGLGATSLLYELVLPRIASFTTACTFDRAGYAWSDPAPAGVSRNSRQLVTEQRHLLQKLHIEPPYILIGNSFGAINCLLFAQLHREEVVGLVLADPSHPEMFERMPGIPSATTVKRMADLFTLLARLRLIGPIQSRLWRAAIPGWQRLPQEIWQIQEHFNRLPQTYETWGREAQDGVESFRAVRDGGYDFGDLPIIVLTGGAWWNTSGNQPGLSARAKRIGLEMRNEMAVWSTRAEHRIIDGATHSITLDGTDAVVQAVQDIFDGVRL